MRESLEQGLSAQRGRAVALRELNPAHNDYGSSFAVARLRAVLDDGEPLAVVLKDLNPLHQSVEARSVRRTGLGRSRRELWMYREVLDSEGLATPRLYGHRWEPKRGLLWLLIEDVGPERLSRVGEFDLWLAAARWSARLHLALKDLAGGEAALMRHDIAESRQHAAQITARLAEVSVEQRAVIRRALELHDEFVDTLDEQPWGVIHGEYTAKNIVVRRGSPDRQIAVLDWETVAHGPLYRDLADISAGDWTRERRVAMWRAYHDQYCRDSGRALAWDRFFREVSEVALVRAVAWLAWWSRENGRHIVRWVDELRRLTTQFFAPAK
ncbi:phosphotransferase [Enhygromyxa salina]|uniref:phosphotransferase n=1 Tax=Enhygromyxa salina TaxID=215803 RepID=UPI0011B1CA95|nr:phosphotransferase [Enhygromyxa salina]